MIKKIEGYDGTLELDYVLRGMLIVAMHKTKTTFLSRLHQVFFPKSVEIMLDDDDLNDMIDFLKNIQDGRNT